MPFEPAYSWNVNLEQLESFQCEELPSPTAQFEAPFRLSRLTGSFKRPQLGFFRSPALTSSIMITVRGYMLVGSPGVKSASVLPERAALFIRGEGQTALKVTAGEHEALVIEWDSVQTPFMETYLEGLLGPRGHSAKDFAIAGLPYEVYDRMSDLLNSPADYAAEHPLQLMGHVYHLTEACVSASGTARLADIPQGVPKPIQTVVRAVIENRDERWDLKMAAERVGYSPFHFSRIFRTHFGFGFHVFVEKCRSERALKMITDTDLPVDIIARKAGFGSTQALRIAVRDNMGMSPTELRHSSEQFSQLIS